MACEPTRAPSAEQAARDLLERIGVPDAQDYSAGNLVELANLIAGQRATVPAALTSHNNADAFWLKTYKPSTGDELLALDVGYALGWNACRAVVLARGGA